MAPREDVRRFVQSLFEPNVAALPIPPEMPTPSSYATVEQIEDEVVRPYSESRLALNQPQAEDPLFVDLNKVQRAQEDDPLFVDLNEVRESQLRAAAARTAAAPMMPAAEPPPSYMEALQRAQAQDRATLVGQAMLGSAEQIARIASRGVYQPTGGARLPSAVAELQQQREAVAEYLAQQRGLRAETRQERASEADLELRRAQAAREEARAKADELRAAIEAAESPERIEKLRAETLAAFERANLYSEQAAQVAKGKQVKMVAGAAPAAKKAPVEKPGRELPASIVLDLSGYDAAVSALQDLTRDYVAADLSGKIMGAASRLGAFAPEQVKLYEAAAGPVRQAIGVILEKGKLAEGDIKRYLDMMPKPGDSREVAERKRDTIIREMRRIEAAQVGALQRAGFKFDTAASQQTAAAAPTAAPAAPSKDDIARAAFAEFKRAQAANAPPDQLERLRAAAEKAIADAQDN